MTLKSTRVHRPHRVRAHAGRESCGWPRRSCQDCPAKLSGFGLPPAHTPCIDDVARAITGEYVRWISEQSGISDRGFADPREERAVSPVLLFRDGGEFKLPAHLKQISSSMRRELQHAPGCGVRRHAIGARHKISNATTESDDDSGAGFVMSTGADGIRDDCARGSRSRLVRYGRARA